MGKITRLDTKILLDGLKFPEDPRWHEDKLWFSDMEAHKVMTIDMNGKTETLFERPNRVSGLGWLPDGSLIIVSMEDSRLLKFQSGKITEHVNLSKFATFFLNDMLIDKKGRIYVGNFGFDYFNQAPFKPTNLIMVSPEGVPKIVAEDMAFPNGMVITPDDKTFIIAETFAARLTAFTINEDGTLKDRRIWANMKSLAPDGICLDEEGGIWVAAPGRHRVARVLKGGDITHVVKVENDAYACILGGPKRRRLFIATSDHSRSIGKIEYVDVEFAAAGLP